MTVTIPLGSTARVLPGIAQQAGQQRADKTQPQAPAGSTFTDLIAVLVNSVNDLQQESAKIQEAFLSGEPVELHQVMIKAEEAGLATELLLEIRNRIVNAYNEMLRMPL